MADMKVERLPEVISSHCWSFIAAVFTCERVQARSMKMASLVVKTPTKTNVTTYQAGDPLVSFVSNLTRAI